MKKLLFAIFAHPDDEAFGPSGTLVLEARSGTEIHLITLTDGSAGINNARHIDLGTVRIAEWHTAAELIGAVGTHHLSYKDGCLCNQTMIEAQKKIISLIRDITAKQECEIELMTIDDNGITGHIDHTVASRAASYVFHTLKQEDFPITRIRYACVSREMFPSPNTNWIYMPAGRNPEEIDEVVDAREVLDTVKDIMHCHHTQRQDAEAHINAHGDNIAINHFIVRS